MPESLYTLAATALMLAAFALLALSQDRHRETVLESDRPLALSPSAQRAIAFIAIALALPLCTGAHGGGLGGLLWAFLAFAAAFAVALALTWRPRWLAPLARALAR